MRKKKKIISSIRIPSLYIRHERWCFGWRLVQQCSSNYGMSVIWRRKQNQILSCCHLLIFWRPACSNRILTAAVVLQKGLRLYLWDILFKIIPLLLFKALIYCLLMRCGWSAQQWEYAWTLTKQSQGLLICLHQADWKSCHLQWCHERSAHYPGNHHASALYLHKKHKLDTNISLVTTTTKNVFGCLWCLQN